MKMDLLLAASEPSPPDRSRLGLRLARDDPETRPLSQLPAPFWSRTTRARFEFAACIHRVKIHPVVDHFVITIALISPRAPGCQGQNDFRVNFFVRKTIWRASCGLRRPCHAAARLCGGSLPCTSGDSSSGRSPVSSSPALPPPDRSPERGLPIPQTCRSVFRRVRLRDPGPRLWKRAFGRSCGTFHSGTSPACPTPRKSWSGSERL